MTSCNGQKKVRLHGKKPGKSMSKNKVATQKISQTGCTQVYSNYIGKKPQRSVSAKRIRPSKLVVTIVTSIYQPDRQLLEKDIRQNGYYD